MNISLEICEAAARLNLDWIGTGGGCDYIYRRLPDGREVTLGASDDAGSPLTLDEGACLTVYPSSDWGDEWVSISFPSARAALEALATIGFSGRGSANYGLTNDGGAAERDAIERERAEDLAEREEEAQEEQAERLRKVAALPSVRGLACEFIRQLNGYLTSDEMLEVVRRNRQGKYANCCASHDFFDANEAMSDAFAMFGVEVDIGCSVEAELWGEAWDMAKEAEFGVGYEDPLELLAHPYVALRDEAGTIVGRVIALPSGTVYRDCASSGDRALPGWEWEHPGQFEIDFGKEGIYALDDDGGARLGMLDETGEQVWLLRPEANAILGIMTGLSLSRESNPPAGIKQAAFSTHGGQTHGGGLPDYDAAISALLLSNLHPWEWDGALRAAGYGSRDIREIVEFALETDRWQDVAEIVKATSKAICSASVS